ncbi:membrane protein insertase YidC [Maridesulfovibrio salexigens]|uniref:Membrane protein insertase YidC n=1 Tax=Maridesulfovibrio salexigens (strain ATCC 14822 / DSM 2638 / NCIMB 8403 / VKM B-1763) TaxID=526222 RepID=YIDC_MARSD|nr:membrane protein insertase YidC [Maridesulfovibrio salexigens]C6C0J6.1 RecName: Full=Membrane protein insertase YidC; AltName: Full=Foldase YidC; AltName: Full=Membrane integrase YidC; AltName: Full=Membrane protein YidC [Maridesulfovibrio salexigens DSM 2638]ACS79130.1 60 kDa inner membrane insertion protein [Maridesulfovibrio salexigens DSM 2638]
MDNKRVILAVALSFAVLLGWQFLFPPQPQQPAPAQQEQTAQPNQAVDSSVAGPVSNQLPDPASTSAIVSAKGTRLTVETPLYSAVINSQGGLLESFKLKKFKATIDADSPDVDMVGTNALDKAPMGLILNGIATWANGVWGYEGANLNLEGDKLGTLIFRGDVEGFRIERRLTFHADNYLIDEDVRVINKSNPSGMGRIAFTTATKSLTAADDRYNPTRIAWFNAEGLVEESDRDTLSETGVTESGKVEWAAIDSNYFILALVPGADSVTMKGKLQDDIFRIAAEQNVSFDKDIERKLACSYYFGPMDAQLMAKVPGELSKAIDFGWFDIIAKPLVVALEWFHQYTNNYGIAIILLTIVIKILFWPLSHKSYKSMEQMKRLQPMMAKLREKHGDDREALNKEMMQLYKTYNVNPAGGCLPMLLQIPVFFGLYKALMGTVALRHADFVHFLPFTDIVWLADLSAKDPLYITPIVMGATMFLQQKMTPSAGDPTQQKIMMFLPLVFTFMFLNFPSGLVVYWMVNNVLSIAQQWMMMRNVKN